MRRLLAGIATSVLTLAPAFGALAAEALAPGTYDVPLGDGVVAQVTLDESNTLSVHSVGTTNADIDLVWQLGDGGWQDEFELVVNDTTTYYVDLNVGADGGYEVYVDGALVVPADDAAGGEADHDAGAPAPGQHGRDNAREHGGEAHGHGAEGTTPSEANGRR